MACNAQTLLNSGYAKYAGLSYLTLLQIIAQEVIEWSQRVNPSVSVEVDDILARACLSQIDCLSKVQLEQAIAQSLCISTPCLAPTPENVSANPGDTSFEVSWTATTNPTVGFTVRYGTSSGVYTDSVSVGPSERAASIGGLDTETEYFFVIVSDSGTCEETSPETSVTTLS